MGKQNPSFRTGLIIGVLAGVLVTGGGSAHSAMGQKAWDSFGKWFKAGYVLGFVDAVRLSKQNNPGGYLDVAYTLPKGVPWTAWAEQVDSMYEDPKFEHRDVPNLLSRAGRYLTNEYGPEPARDPQEGLKRFKAAVERVKKSEKASAEKAAGGTTPDTNEDSVPEGKADGAERPDAEKAEGD